MSVETCAHMVTAEKLQTCNLLHKLACVCPFSLPLAVLDSARQGQRMSSDSRKPGPQRALCMKTDIPLEQFSTLNRESSFSMLVKNRCDQNKSKTLGIMHLNRQKNISIRNQWEHCVQQTDYVILQPPRSGHLITGIKN